MKFLNPLGSLVPSIFENEEDQASDQNWFSTPVEGATSAFRGFDILEGVEDTIRLTAGGVAVGAAAPVAYIVARGIWRAFTR